MFHYKIETAGSLIGWYNVHEDDVPLLKLRRQMRRAAFHLLGLLSPSLEPDIVFNIAIAEVGTHDKRLSIGGIPDHRLLYEIENQIRTMERLIQGTPREEAPRP